MRGRGAADRQAQELSPGRLVELDHLHAVGRRAALVVEERDLAPPRDFANVLGLAKWRPQTANRAQLNLPMRECMTVIQAEGRRR
jgi:hypothetical protein